MTACGTKGRSMRAGECLFLVEERSCEIGPTIREGRALSQQWTSCCPHLDEPGFIATTSYQGTLRLAP